MIFIRRLAGSPDRAAASATLVAPIFCCNGDRRSFSKIAAGEPHDEEAFQFRFGRAIFCLAAPGQAAEPTSRVLTYHAGVEREGDFVIPALSWERARVLHPDDSCHAQIVGHVYAQPLYWQPSGTGAGVLLVATEDDTVYSLDAGNGKTLWRQSLGKPVPRSALPCGNINPLGITGTPVIDLGRQAVYLDAMLQNPQAGMPEPALFALSLRDGSVLLGRPVDVAAALKVQGIGFDSRNQNERGALTILDVRSMRLMAAILATVRAIMAGSSG